MNLTSGKTNWAINTSPISNWSTGPFKFYTNGLQATQLNESTWYRWQCQSKSWKRWPPNPRDWILNRSKIDLNLHFWKYRSFTTTNDHISRNPFWLRRRETETTSGVPVQIATNTSINTSALHYLEHLWSQLSAINGDCNSIHHPPSCRDFWCVFFFYNFPSFIVSVVHSNKNSWCMQYSLFILQCKTWN